MRIIDADKFKQQIAGMAILNDYSAQKVNKMCKLIDAQPTAYDVDEVVKQLNEASCIARPVGWSRKKEIIELKTAIEIVKAGGIDGN